MNWQHDASVFGLYALGMRGGYRASCICGWVGGRCDSERSAQQDADNHNSHHNRPASPVDATRHTEEPRDERR